MDGQSAHARDEAGQVARADTEAAPVDEEHHGQLPLPSSKDRKNIVKIVDDSRVPWAVSNLKTARRRNSTRLTFRLLVTYAIDNFL